ncbi:hypothetical protein Dda_3953 [Drechslerella dactyloides]|uniref:Alkaline phosphatase n=1 Tax=Drechslerella dactyloides TaxID=74499 RepID=A0AAD6IYV2_DREDA|nr:hypothetical protein Dda_3953 [Drechslerella dactyloides]
MAQSGMLSPAPVSGYQSDDPSAEEALLTGEHVDRKDSGDRIKGTLKRWKNPIITLWAAIATIIILVIGVLYVRSHPEGGQDHMPHKAIRGKRNLIFMVSDGMGPTSLELTRSWRQFTENLPYDDVLTLDKHFIGSSRTRSSNSLITDSAAGATAFSCGLKSYNGAISILPGGDPCGTVLEAAKAAGYMTGLVVTTSITDATPACFNAHVNMRWEQDRIAEQQIGDYPLGRVTDLMLGGGYCHFLPNSTKGSCRADNRDLVEEARANNINFIHKLKEFHSLKLGEEVNLPLFGLFASTDIPFDLDRSDDEYPSLPAMAETAITALELATKDSDKGYFLMIEGSRIDHAGHANDPAAQVREVRAYDRTFEVVLKKIEESSVETIVVSTSDHETGGLAAARQLHEAYPDYLWYPGVLANASRSSEFLSSALISFKGTDKSDIAAYLEKELFPLAGITDAGNGEIIKLVHYKIEKMPTGPIWADMISRRAQIGWSTHGHSAVDVNIYGYPFERVKKLWGNHENTEIGEFLRDYLNVDVDAVTKKLRGTADASWMGKGLHEILEETGKSMGVGGAVGEETVSGLNDYQGIHKRACMH